MKNETALRFVEEILAENRENGELEGILNRSRVAALRRVLLLAEPEFLAHRRGNRLVLYQRGPSGISGVRRYRRVASLKLPGRFANAPRS
jgi:hypothetical protein